MQLSTRWLHHLNSLPQTRQGIRDVIVFYQEGDKQRIAYGEIWKDGTLQTLLPMLFSERQITNIKSAIHA